MVRFLTRSLTLLLVIIAIAMSLLRWAAPSWLEENSDWLLGKLGEMSGYHFSANTVTSHWYRSGPVLLFENFELRDQDNNQTILRMDHLRLRLSLYDLVRYRNLVPTSVAVDGMTLTLLRNRDGRISAYGIQQQPEQALQPATDISYLLLQPEFMTLTNTRINFVDLLNGNRISKFDPAEVTLINHADHHQLSARLGIDSTNRGEMTLTAEFQTQENRLEAWDGNVYLLTSELDLAWLLGERIPGHYRISSGASSFEAWSTWKAGRLQQLAGRLSANTINLRSPDHEAPSLPIDWLSAHFRWKSEPNGWRLDLSNAQITSNKTAWPTQAFSLALRRENPASPFVLYLGADQIEIPTLIATLGFRTVEQLDLERIYAANPSGMLGDLQLAIRMKRPVQWFASAELLKVSLEPTGKLPGFENLQGTLAVDNDSGLLSLRTTASQFDYPNLFRNPLPIKELKGDLAWFRQENAWHVASNGLLLDTGDLVTDSLFRLTTRENNRPIIDLLSTFRNGNAKATSTYLPVKIMKPHLVDWLDRSIKEGRVTGGTAIVRGPLEHFPFHTPVQGTFDISFTVEDAVLDYWPGWPPLESLSAAVRFHANSMTIDASCANLYDSRILGAQATINSLKPIEPLQISGALHGPLEDAFRFLRESPLRERFGNLAGQVKASGPSNIAIDLRLPLHKSHPATLFQGSVDLLGNRLEFSNLALPLDNMTGVLHITEQGLFADMIKTRFLGTDLEILVQPDPKGGTTITSGASLSMDMLKQQLPGLKALPASGASDWQLQVAIPPATSSNPPLFTAESNLAGTQIDLPLFFEKQAHVTRQTRVQIPMTAASPTISLRYGDTDIKLTAGGETGSMASPQIKGVFTLPVEENPRLIADLEYLKLRFDTANGQRRARKAPGNPRDLPLLAVKSEQLVINDILFGKLDLETRYRQDGLEISKLVVGDKKTSLTADGNWLLDANGHHTNFSAEIKADKLGDALKGLGLTEQLEGSPGTLTANVHWNDAPVNFAVDRLQGELKLNAGKGRFTETQPGFGRLIGLTNLRALQRRLTLDFSDFTKEGFSYDKINGSAELAGGIATINRLRIQAPAGNIDIHGTTNLRTGELNQKISVLPEIHGTLPIAGTLAGGPAVGAALLVAGAIAGDEIDKLAKIEYSVTGTWDDPLIERIGGTPAGEENGEDADQIDSQTGLPEID